MSEPRRPRRDRTAGRGGGVLLLIAGMGLGVGLAVPAVAAPTPTPTTTKPTTTSATPTVSHTSSTPTKTTRTTKPKTTKTKPTKITKRTTKTKQTHAPRTTTTSPRPTTQACAVRYVLVSAWDDGFQGSLVVSHALDLSGWTLGWDFPGTQKITQVLLAHGTQTGTHVSVSNPDVPDVAAETPLVLDFVATGDADTSTPRSVTLNGLACS